MKTVPGFSRVEIRTRGRVDLINAAHMLKELAADLEAIATSHDDDAAVVLAHHRIRSTSQQLRGKQ